MRFGLNNKGKRIRPSQTGERAICDMCNEVLIAHYGQFRQHWQHESKKDCDSWKGKETEWHLNWKSNFPDNCQEVVITKDEEKHRADVMTENNLVIEFQNSSISYSDIKIREQFYGDMIWVINAEEFKSNFETKSIVLSHLRRAETNAHFEFLESRNAYNEEIEVLDTKIKNEQYVCDLKSGDIKKNNKKKEKFNNQLSNIDSFVKEIIDTWRLGDFLFDSNRFEIINELDAKFRTDIENLSKEIEEGRGKIKTLNHKLNIIESFEDYKIEDEIFKIISYPQISPENYSKVKAIEKNNNLFTEINSINSLAEFNNYSYKKDNFIFVVDPREKIDELNREIKQTTSNLDTSKDFFHSYQKELITAIKKALETKISSLKKENKELNTEWDEAIQLKMDLVSKKVILKENKDAWLSEKKSEIDRFNNRKRSKIMNSKKGLYSFYWKHERKSWTAAKYPIYFDLGNGYLLKRLQDSLVKKISVEEFLSIYQN